MQRVMGDHYRRAALSSTKVRAMNCWLHEVVLYIVVSWSGGVTKFACVALEHGLLHDQLPIRPLLVTVRLVHSGDRGSRRHADPLRKTAGVSFETEPPFD